jgi:hypothetical protein
MQLASASRGGPISAVTANCPARKTAPRCPAGGGPPVIGPPVIATPVIATPLAAAG